jgi:hypothetical protein
VAGYINIGRKEIDDNIRIRQVIHAQGERKPFTEHRHMDKYTDKGRNETG